MDKLSDSRIRELLAAEEKLNALEAGGVDNWDGYDFAMEPIRAKQEREEFLEGIADNITEILGAGVDEPAGSGCGYGFRYEASVRLLDYLRKLQIVDNTKDKVRAS
jgi:hypothetical protein